MPIPKIIHYAWFSDQPMDGIYQECFASWSQHIAGFKMHKWDRSQSVDSDFFNKMIGQKKWAFASDYIRLYALYTMGGIYLDLDVKVIKDLSPVLKYNCLFGREDKDSLAAHFIAATKGHPFIKECLVYYDKSLRLKVSPPPTMPRIITKLAGKYDLETSDSMQVLTNDITVYPSNYFSPLHYKERLTKSPHRFISGQSYCIHYWQHGWSWLNSAKLAALFKNQPWLFMNGEDWKRFLIHLKNRIL